MNKVEKPCLTLGQKIPLALSLTALAFVGIGCKTNEGSCNDSSYSWGQSGCLNSQRGKAPNFCCLTTKE